MNQYQQGISTAKQFSIGGILNRTLAVLLKNPVLFIMAAVLAALPNILGEILFSQSLAPQIVLQIVSVILGLIAQGFITYGAFQTLLGRNVNFGECFSRGTTRIVPLFLAAVITGLGVGLATVLFIIPGLILLCFWAVAIPACVVERLGPVESVKRSTYLTEGHRWPIFGLILIVGLGTILLAFGLAFILIITTGNVILGSIVALLICTIPQAFGYVMYAIIYHELRAIKEGVSLDNLIRVFE